MKRILHVIAELGVGGAEKVSMDLGLFMKRFGYDSHYIVFGETVGEYEIILKENHQTILHFDSPGNGYFRFFRQLLSLMRKYKYQVVHAHTMFNCGIVMLAARMAGVPVRVSHAHSALLPESNLLRGCYEHLMRILMFRCSTDLVACGLAAGKKLFGPKALAHGCKVILNGVNLDAFRFQSDRRYFMRDKLGLNDSFVIGHSGRMVDVKNQQFLVKLLPRIQQIRPDAKLLLLGDGEERPMIQTLINELELNDSVVVPGTVLNVNDYLNCMDVFAFPSLYEGMPLSIIEVQANGLPCVLSTGVPKDVYLTDLVTPLPLDKPEDWVEAICGARRGEPENYADELKAKGFDTETVMRKFLKIYERADRN